MRPGIKYRSATSFPPLCEEFFESTGEYRQPLAGEWYISGAIPEVYKATHDLNTPFHIARPIPAPPKIVIVNGFRYSLMM